ncbi:hypothetical protein [Marinitoga lauensis]|nr:hypothetical protein [Marinitoga lauensis]
MYEIILHFIIKNTTFDDKIKSDFSKLNLGGNKYVQNPFKGKNS